MLVVRFCILAGFVFCVVLCVCILMGVKWVLYGACVFLFY